MKRFGSFLPGVLFLALVLVGFNAMMRVQGDILKTYFIDEPARRAHMANASISESISKYFERENQSAGLDAVGAYLKSNGTTDAFSLTFVYKDTDGRLKEASSSGVVPAGDGVMKSEWVYPVTVDSGRLAGYLIVDMGPSGQAELREGLRKYLFVSYSLRVIVGLLLVMSLLVLIYYRYSGKMRLARDAAELKASTDGLTGLYTHEYCMKALRLELDKARAYHVPVALLMIDIDYFKKFNDTHGHQAGDCVLEEVAAVLKANTRSLDIVARYGGEEFAAIVPYQQKQNTTGDITEGFVREVEALAERIRKSVEGKTVEYEGASLAVTVSIGVTYAPAQGAGMPAASFIQRADKALYEAKAAGRNRVILHTGTCGWTL